MNSEARITIFNLRLTSLLQNLRIHYNLKKISKNTRLSFFNEEDWSTIEVYEMMENTDYNFLVHIQLSQRFMASKINMASEYTLHKLYH